ncbi:MAG: endonuclease/exonuclease/phosphatase family protein [Deltaproteobacteria bacterium]|nr:endonuclease/exonuclease/phosphatase family protein [Deltaproteobacteria bacterium]
MRLALRTLRVAGLGLGGLIVAFAVFYLWGSSGFDDTDPLPVPPERYGGHRSFTPPVARASRIRVVSWNIAYARGRKDDAGDLRDEATIRRNLVGIAHLLRTLDADVVALQEVDFGAARTHGIDEVAWLAREAGYPWAARVETWNCRYIPFPYWPPSQHYGRMRSGQAVLSRFPIASNVRHLLPQPDENPFWYNAFYLHRALQHVELSVGGGITLDVLNVHLEAFHQRNRERHADLLVSRVRSLPDRPRLVLGDFNAIPPEAVLRARFPDELETDMTTDRTIATVRTLGLQEALPPETPDVDSFTFPADVPNRRLDYVWFSPDTRRISARVVREAGPLSDHLPVLAEIEFR